MSLFEPAPLPAPSSDRRPLADRMRPETLEEFVGQAHILGPGKPLRQQIEQKRNEFQKEMSHQDEQLRQERDALLRIMLPILADPKRVVAVGGIIRVLNGSEIASGNLRRVRLPRKSIEVIQVIEYLRAFLIGREAWGQGNMLMIISGAFGVFRTDLVRAIGGYRPAAIGEDFDVVTRLHRHLLEKGADYRIQFVPDPMCWTEVPSDLQSLGRQRARWQKGLLDVLWLTRGMLFRARYGRIGCFALPYCGCSSLPRR